MLRILCLALCGLLPGTRADPGALLRLGMDILNHGEPAGWGEGPGVGCGPRGWWWQLMFAGPQIKLTSNVLLLLSHPTEGEIEAQRK